MKNSNIAIIAGSTIAIIIIVAVYMQYTKNDDVIIIDEETIETDENINIDDGADDIINNNNDTKIDDDDDVIDNDINDTKIDDDGDINDTKIDDDGDDIINNDNDDGGDDINDTKVNDTEFNDADDTNDADDKPISYESPKTCTTWDNEELEYNGEMPRDCVLNQTFLIRSNEYDDKCWQLEHDGRSGKIIGKKCNPANELQKFKYSGGFLIPAHDTNLAIRQDRGRVQFSESDMNPTKWAFADGNIRADAGEYAIMVHKPTSTHNYVVAAHTDIDTYDGGDFRVVKI